MHTHICICTENYKRHWLKKNLTCRFQLLFISFSFKFDYIQNTRRTLRKTLRICLQSCVIFIILTNNYPRIYLSRWQSGNSWFETAKQQYRSIVSVRIKDLQRSRKHKFTPCRKKRRLAKNTPDHLSFSTETKHNPVERPNDVKDARILVKHY